MHLLRRCDTGEFKLAQVGDEAIPPYAILSHTWGADGEEVTFEDLTNGTGKDKPGYEKVLFCGKQAAQDGLKWFWIDTCCINKANYAELSHSINSMFRWYRNATRCYVYLSDVPISSFDSNDEYNLQSWVSGFWKSKWFTQVWTLWELLAPRSVELSSRERQRLSDKSPPFSSNDVYDPQLCESDFRKSRWFTRGWTLQELLAPRSVEFFSRDRIRLGDKCSLKQAIHEITGIPESALQGVPLSQFSVKERFSWIQPRKTKVEEDKAYSLLGIFDVQIPLRYNEGVASAFKRLEKEIDKLNKCIQDLRLTDPRDDKKRIEDTKGGLLENSYRWILENSDFQQWRNDEQSRLLWIKGDPGKGKTMLLCGIIDKLEKSIAKSNNLLYFFCQATDSRINNATAVLRGLIYMLVGQQPLLVSHVRNKYDQSGKALFEDSNAWVALSGIFTDILQDPNLNSTYLIIDALDECVADLPKLLDFVVRNSATSPCVKWIVSSRNWPSIAKDLDAATHKARLCLELNEKSVSAAVATYIQAKVDCLAKRNNYSTDTRHTVQLYLLSNANGTFLWVALVCHELASISGWDAEDMSKAFPPELDLLYKRMLDQIGGSRYTKLCENILAVVSAVYRPLTLDELASFVDMPGGVSGNYKALTEIVELCGSFLTLQEHTISFVHQSAKDFLVEKAYNEIYPSGVENVHQTVFSRSLQVMSEKLKRDAYGLRAPDFPIDQVDQKKPDPDPLSQARYSCVYWIDHLLDCDPFKDAINDLQDGGSVDKFLRRSYLYWLEALSLYRSLSEGVVSITKLEALLQVKADASALIGVIRDARRFIKYHKHVIEENPLQVYASALVFSPASSLIRGLFKKEEPNWITIKPGIEDEWGACLQTLEGHSNWVQSVAFSHDSTRLASASMDNTVKIWDANSGACLQTLEGHSGSVQSVAFSHDSTRLASASSDNTVKIWDANSGACLQTLKGHSGWVLSVAFSHDSMRLASASSDKTVKIWDANSGACLQTLEVGMALSDISFDTTGLYLHTQIGTISVSAIPLASSSTPVVIEAQKPRYQGLALSLDKAWITHSSKKLVWLPSEYRPSCSATSDRTIGIGVGTGRVWICESLLDIP